MTDTRILLDPTAEQTSATRQRLSRPSSLADLTVGLLDISKARGDIFLDQLETQLAAQGVAIKRFRKNGALRQEHLPSPCLLETESSP